MSRTLAFVVLALASCAAAPRRDVSHEIESICRAQEDAWNSGDVERFLALGYWRSPALTFFSQGDDTRGFEPVLARYVKRYEAEGAETGHLAFTRLEVVPLAADAAIARGRWDLDFASKPDVGGLFTLVFRRIDGAWRIVHDHTSVDAAK